MQFNTQQELFEHVAKHLFKQGVQSIDESGNCLYRGSNGTSCAVGCALPDENYNVKMEGYGIGDSLFSDFTIPNYISNNRNLMSRLQDIHDADTNWIDTVHMRRCLDQVAFDHNLNAIFLQDLSFKDR